jgi:hypothetical protein
MSFTRTRCPTRDLCCDFKNIFAEKFCEQKFAFFTQNKAKLCKKLIITLVFQKNANFFAVCKLAKIAENCDHNIDPRSVGQVKIIRKHCSWAEKCSEFVKHIGFQVQPVDGASILFDQSSVFAEVRLRFSSVTFDMIADKWLEGRFYKHLYVVF